MVYTKTVWTNREVEKPRTFTMVDNGDGTTTLTPAEGTIITAGTPIDAVNMNKIENEIAFQSGRIQSGVKSGTGNGTPTLVVDLTFPTAFLTVPVVVGVASISTLSVAITNITTTACQLVVRHVDNGNWVSVIGIQWIAIAG